MKRHASTIVLLLLVIGVALYLWRDKDKITTTERQDRSNDVFPAWRREDLSRIEILHDNETIVLTRDPKADTPWRLAGDERADQAAVERLATTFEFATRVRKVAANDPVGLQTPRAHGSITMGKLVFGFALGNASPRPEGSGYLKVDDGEPFVASKEMTDALLASVDAYRDRSVIPYLSTEMTRFGVAHAGGGFVVERLDDRSFQLPMLNVLASRVSLDKVWSALAEMRAESFPKDADVDRLIKNPRLTITIAPKDKSKPAGALFVGEACPGHPDDVIVLRTQPTRVAACAPKGAMEALAEITPSMLVDRRPFAFRHDEIEEFKLEATGGSGAPKPIELARRGMGFHERTPEDRELTPFEADSVGDDLAALEKMDATDVKPGFGAPFTAVAKAHVWANEIEEAVEIGADEITVRRLRDDARLTFTKEQVRRLMPRTSLLKSLVLLGETRKVTRVLLRCGVEQELVDSGSGLTLITPAGYETDGSISQLVDGLVRGKINAWTADRDDGAFGITPNGCRVVLSFADGNAPATITFGGPAEDGVYGSVDGRPEVFVASSALASLVKRIYISRSSLRVQPERIEKVVVKKQGKVVDTDAARLKDAVGSFYADHAISLTNDLGAPADLEISVTVADAGIPKVIRCAGSRCSVAGVKAVFEVPAANMNRLFTDPLDAGVVR